MSRHGRHDDHSENARQDLFADPYAGGYTEPPVDRTGSENPYRSGSEDPYRSDPRYRYDDPYASDPRGHDAYGHDPYGNDSHGCDPYGGGGYEGVPSGHPEARRPDPDDHETTVLNFEPGVFDGPPPGHAEQGYGEQGYAEQGYGDGGYAGSGYEYEGSIGAIADTLRPITPTGDISTKSTRADTPTPHATRAVTTTPPTTRSQRRRLPPSSVRSPSRSVVRNAPHA